MAQQAPATMPTDSTFFSIFLTILTAALKIKKPTPILIPLNAYATSAISRNRSKHTEISRMMQKDGTMIPKIGRAHV